MIQHLTLYDTYVNELRISIHAKIFTQMFIVGLIIIAQTWKQPRCLSVGEWINIQW